LRTPHTDCCTHHFAEPFASQRLPLCQCKANIRYRCIIQFTAEQPSIFSDAFSLILAQCQIQRVWP
jgi:hypothetical protein